MMIRKIVVLGAVLALGTAWISCGDDSGINGPEDSIARCSDGWDNDGDGAYDCQDTDCSYRYPGLCSADGGGLPDSGTPLPDSSTTLPDAGPPEEGLCKESFTTDCSDCPVGWRDCITFTNDNGPDKVVCSKSCTSNSDCGTCGMCYDGACYNYDAYSVGYFCPANWTCALPDYSHCQVIGDPSWDWQAEGLPAFITSWDTGYVDQLYHSMGSDYPDIYLANDVWADDAYPTPLLGTFDLRAYEDGNYSTCTHCLRLYTGCDSYGGNCAKEFFQAAGTGSYSVVGSSAGEDYSGSLTDVVFVEVTYDPETFWSTPVPGGDCYRIPGLSWGSALEEESTGGTDPPPQGGLSASGGAASSGG